MTIDSLTLENVIRNLEKANGMEQDINSSLRAARNGLHSRIANDVKEIKIENNCSSDINLASQIHDAFVSIERENVEVKNGDKTQFNENNNQNKLEDTKFSKDVIIKAENSKAESTGAADSINGEQKKGKSIVASETNKNTSDSSLPNSANSASGVYDNNSPSQTTEISPTSLSTATESSNSQASVQIKRDAMLKQIDNSVGGFDAPKAYSFDTDLSSNIPEEENNTYADLSDIFEDMTIEQQVDLLKTVYTDEYIDALDIDADLKEMLKNCVHNNNVGSFMLAVELISTTEDLKAAQLKQTEFDKIGDNEQSRLAKQEVTALSEKLLELNSQIELMQYVEYFGLVSETELQYSYDLLEAITLDEKGFPNINPLAYDDMSTDNASRFMSYLAEGYYGELIKNIDYDINDDISPLQKIELVKSIIEKLKTEYGFNPAYDFELVYSDNLEMMAVKHFTIQERNVYEKIYREEGAEEATKFLNSMRLTLNNREGWELAKEYYNQVISGKTTVNRLLKTGLIGINNGVVSHFENLHSFVFQDLTKTSNEYASDYFTQLLMEGYVAAQMGEINSKNLLDLKNSQFINEDQFKELKSLARQRKREGRELNAIDVMYVAGYYDMDMYSYMQDISQSEEFKNFVNTQNDVEEYLAKNCYSAGSSIGNMLPSIAMSIALSPLGGAFTLGESTVTWGQIAANVSMFSSSATGSWKEAMRKGHTMGDSILYGLANGGSETLTGFFIGRIPFVSRFSSALEKLGGSGSHVLIQAAINLGKDILGEVTEEIVQLPLGGIFDTAILGEDVNWSEIAAQIPDTIVSTVISTGVTNGVPVTLQLGGYAINVSVNDIFAIANSKNSKEMLAALVGAKINPNAIVASFENTNLNEAQIAYVVSRLRTDKARINGLQYVTNDIARTRIVQTFLTDNAKLSALQYITLQENQEAIVKTLSKENQLKALEIYPDLNIEGITDVNDSFTPTEERIQQDKTEISTKIQGFINQIFTEFAPVIPQNIKDTLGNIQNIEDIVHIDETGTISLYVNNGQVYLPKNAYTVLNLLSKIPGFGSIKNHATHSDTNLVINNNTFLNFVSHVFLKGLTPEQYFSEIALHETFHLCGSDGSWGLFEGITEFKTREFAQKYGLETSACGYPKETRIAYELQQLFGKEVIDKIAFAPNEGGVNAVETKYQIILESLGKEEAELFFSVVNHMQVQFNPYITKNYPGLLGILNKCYQYSKIDYSKVYDMINEYRINHGLEVVDFTKTDIIASDIDSLYADLLNGTVEAYNSNSDLNTEQVGNVIENIVELSEEHTENLDSILEQSSTTEQTQELFDDIQEIVENNEEIPYHELSVEMKQSKLKKLLSNPEKLQAIFENGSYLGENIEIICDDIFKMIDSGNTNIIPSNILSTITNPIILIKNLLTITNPNLIELILEQNGVKDAIIQNFSDNDKYNLISIGLKDNQFIKKLILSFEAKDKYVYHAMLFVKDVATFLDLLKNDEVFKYFSEKADDSLKTEWLNKIADQDVFVKLALTISDPNIVYSAIYNYNLDDKHKLDLINQMFDDFDKINIVMRISNDNNLLTQVLETIDFSKITVENLIKKFNFKTKGEIIKFTDIIIDKLGFNEKLQWINFLNDIQFEDKANEMLNKLIPELEEKLASMNDYQKWDLISVLPFDIAKKYINVKDSNILNYFEYLIFNVSNVNPDLISYILNIDGILDKVLSDFNGKQKNKLLNLIQKDMYSELQIKIIESMDIKKDKKMIYESLKVISNNAFDQIIKNDKIFNLILNANDDQKKIFISKISDFSISYQIALNIKDPQTLLFVLLNNFKTSDYRIDIIKNRYTDFSSSFRKELLTLLPKEEIKLKFEILKSLSYMQQIEELSKLSIEERNIIEPALNKINERINSFFKVSKERMVEITQRIMKNKILGVDLTFDRDGARDHVNEIFGINNDVIHFGNHMQECYDYFANYIINNNFSNYLGKGANTILTEYLESLPEDVKLAIKIYTGSYYAIINNNFTRLYYGVIDDKTDTLYYHKEMKTYEIKELVYLLDSFFKNHFLNQDIILYRGVEINVFKSLGIYSQHELIKLNSGIAFQPDFGFGSSTAISDKGFTGRDINLVMRVKAGTGLFNIDPISSCSGEQEVLLQRNCIYHYLGVEEVVIDGEKRYYVYCEVEPMSEELLSALSESNTEVDVVTPSIEIKSDEDINDMLAKFLDVKVDDKSHILSAEEAEMLINANGNLDFIPEKISEYLDKTFADDSVMAYYTLLNISGLEFSDSKTKSWIISEIINHSQVTRNAIYQETKSQIDDMLSTMLNINDPFISDELVSNILGNNFVSNGIDTQPNWDGFINKIESYVKSKFDELIKQKEPILWGKIEDENHHVMNDTFTTIENTTIGEGLYFLDLVYSNWDESSSKLPKLEDFWAKLSKLYVDVCCEAINPNTGSSYDNIRFVTSNNQDLDTCFGNIFQTTELPEIIKDGKIKYITLTTVEQSTMTIDTEVKIDISELITKYRNLLLQSSDDIFLKQQLFDDFKNKVKEASNDYNNQNSKTNNHNIQSSQAGFGKVDWVKLPSLGHWNW